jgi:hypothetical protein
MSTKTTFKRVALVAVAALGFGVLTSVSPANAADTASFTVNTDSVTVVTNGTTASEVTLGAIFKVSLRNDGTTQTAQALQSTESLTVTVVGVPTGTASTAKTVGANAAELTITKLAPGTDNGAPYAAGQAWSAAAGSSGSPAAANGTNGFGSQDTAYNNNAGNSTSTFANTLYFGVKPATGENDVIGEGTYTLRLRLTTGTGSLLVQDKLVKVTFVNGAVNSGAILTASTAGVFPVGVAHSAYALTKHIKATITDANGGVLIGEDTAGQHNLPDLTVDMVDKDGAVVTAATGLTEVDNAGTADHGYTTTLTGYSDSITANIASSRNGTFGITGTTDSFPAASTTNKIRVRYGASSATGAITIINTPGGTAGTPVITAAGLSATSAAPTWTVPLTTKTVNYAVTGGISGQTYTYTVTWSGTHAAGDVSPVSATPKTVVADASGVIRFDITNAAPLDTASAAIVVTGFASNASAATQTVNWAKSAAASASVDMNGAYVALKAATKFTATFLDNYGAPVAGLVVRPSVAGINKDAATAPRATLVTDAKGQVSITLTDALAAAEDTDTVTFASLSPSVSASSTITYAATAPVATALTAKYNANPTTAAASIVTLIPATGIYVTGTDKFPVQIARNNVNAVTPTNAKDHLIFRVSAGVAGVAVTASASTGAYVLGSISTQVASATKYTDADGFVEFVAGSNAAGANTITFTSGTATTSGAFWTATAAANARFVTLTQDATTSVVTAKLTDRYGNGVSGETIQISTNNGTLGNGQLTTVYTTDTTGSISVLPVGTSGATVTATLTSTTANDTGSIAGYVGAVVVESTLAAGNKTATLKVADSATSSAAAEAATDAAAEATDAANAATDAANAAAEAADAATAAAQDAADAVAALSTQVSEMVNALKKQITALTNLVIKIQKKVKA